MKKYIYIFLASCFPFFGAKAQIGTSIGFFENLPQRVYANPALVPNQKINVGLPFLSATFVEHGNNWFDPDNTLRVGQDGVATLDVEAILAEIDDAAEVRQRNYNELFHLGFFVGKEMNSYVHIRVTERIAFGLAIPEDMIKLAYYGNASTQVFDENTADFSPFDVSLNHYREYAVGFGTKIGDRFRVGGTLKYLYGMENVQTEVDGLKLRTDPRTYDLSSSGSLAVRTSGIYGLVEDDAESNQDDIRNYLIGLDNNGFGFDLGITARFFDHLEVQVSALNLGWITWRSDVATYTIDDAAYLYSGVDLTNVLFEDGGFDDNLETQLDSLVDDLEDKFVPEREVEAYTAALDGIMRYAAAYDFEELINLKGSAWLSFAHGIQKGFPENVLGIGYTHRVGNWFEVNLNMNSRNMRSPALGAGMTIKGGPLQVYVLVNNFQLGEYTQFTMEDDDGSTSSFFYPNNPTSLVANVGVNFVFGERKEDRAQPRMISD